MQSQVVVTRVVKELTLQRNLMSTSLSMARSCWGARYHYWCSTLKNCLPCLLACAPSGGAWGENTDLAAPTYLFPCCTGPPNTTTSASFDVILLVL